MGNPSPGNVPNPECMDIPYKEVEIFIAYAKLIDEGQPYSPTMIAGLAHPYLKKKLLEIVCLRASG
jgi:hypothetical protein